MELHDLDDNCSTTQPQTVPQAATECRPNQSQVSPFESSLIGDIEKEGAEFL